MIRDILRMGDSRLLARSVPVERFATPELTALLADLRDTMAAANGAGLAAPQIGVGLRVVIFGFEHNQRYPDAEPVPYTELVNPAITPLTLEMEEDWEGCLSVPGMRGIVPRYRKLRYSGFDIEGNPFEREAEGFHARVVQAIFAGMEERVQSLKAKHRPGISERTAGNSALNQCGGRRQFTEGGI